MTKQEIKTAIRDYFTKNPDAFTECIEDLDSWNGYIGDDRYYPMEDLDEIYHDVEPLEFLNRVFYGHDDDSCIIDQWGKKHYSEFNPNREYFRYNGYGNLVSSDYKDYSDLLDNYVIDAMIENRYHIDAIENDSELSELFDAAEELED